jgi:hypothetical protein
MSPTPRRFHGIDFESGEDEGLSTIILQLLRSNNVVVRASTEARLRHTITSEIGVYETKLRTSEQTISQLCKRLDGLEC